MDRNRFLGLYSQLAPHFAAMQPGSTGMVFPEGSDELFIGRAGYLCGLYELRRITGEVSTLMNDNPNDAMCRPSSLKTPFSRSVTQSLIPGRNMQTGIIQSAP